MKNGQAKVSRFNVYVTENGTNGAQFVYNTLSGSITRLDAQLASQLRNGDTSHLLCAGYHRVAEALEAQGVLVADGVYELAEYEKLHHRWKEGKENVEINALLTYDCNFCCPYCYEGRGAKGQQIHGNRYMSPELLSGTEQFIKRTAAERDAARLEIVLYGGEPFRETRRSRRRGRPSCRAQGRWAGS